MKFTKLKITGFKSFVDTTIVDIKGGLTGLVGPNGCGKSNIVEAIKWNMGEAGPSRLRAGEMNDLIFAGTKGRASRNSAEVILTIEDGGHLTIDGSGVSGSSSSLGDLTAVGSTLSSPSNADLTLNSSGGNVNIEGLTINGTNISTTDSSAGVEITGNLIPSQNGVFTLGSSNRRWQTAFLAAETIDLGGATISSDGTGTINIAATGATLPTGSKVKSGDTTQGIQLQGKTSATANRPIQLVNVYTSDGSTTFTDAQLLAKAGDLELEFNGTVEEIPVYTEAGQTFTLSNGSALSGQYSSRVTLFQF